MRERLGWLTSCTNAQSCPQNWLERSVSELPTTVPCHVCRREVNLVKSEERLQALDVEGQVVAFPAVPPISLDSVVQLDGDSGGPAAVPATYDMAPPARPAPESAPRSAPRGSWMCTLASGESTRIDRPEMVIGRSRTCDVVIPSAKVSRQHAKLSLQGAELWIEDLGSANGVWHEGVKVTRTRVSSGDTFTISDETLLFEVR